MTDAAFTPIASLDAALIRRRSPSIAHEALVAPSTWRADLRFFLTCYACGLAAVLVMLS